MRVLLVSTYELGRQPLHAASPAAALLRAGHEVRVVDLAVQEWDDGAVAWAEAVAFSVPMHTAMRLAVRGAERVRAARPEVPVAFYGLYAPVSADRMLAGVADRLIAGEYEPGLLEWVGSVSGSGSGGLTVHRGRSDFAVPARHLLPPLDRYARLAVGDEERVVGAVEASHGCNHRCRHCPVPAVYDGRTRVVDVDLLMADVERLVAMGARHLTFGDPDFLSGPAHALRVVRALREGFPGLTFDVTVKVEHVLAFDVWDELAAAGCLFVVSAVETLDDRVLGLLDKGHTAAEASRAVVRLREAGIDAHPSFLPFTPWTTPSSLLDILDFVAAHDVVPVVDPVQYTLRLLLPEGSLLLDVPGLAPFLDGYDADALTWRWRAADPAVDRLQAELAAVVEAGVAGGAGNIELYAGVRARVAEAAGAPERAAPPPVVSAAPEGPRARLTEPWFCCAEPTEVQLGPLRAE